MCGLYGVWADKIGMFEKEDFRTLAWLNLPRGRDSAGLMVGNTNGKNKRIIHMGKSVEDAASFFKTKRVAELAKLDNIFMMAGHNRAATIGNINYHNAHPIHENNIIGQHNGTIESLSKQAEKEKTSDSRLLMKMLHTEGLEKTINELWGSDAFALAYVNLKESTFNLVRNGMRPLHIMFAKGKNSFYWSSEERALKFIADGYVSGRFLPPFELDDHTLMRVKLGSVKVEEVPLDVSPKRSYFPPLHDAGYASPYTPPWKDDSKAYASWLKRRKENKALPEAPGLTKEQIDDLEARQRRGGFRLINPEAARVYFGYEKNVIALKVAEKILQRGCCFCGSPAQTTDLVWWLDHTQYVCEENGCFEDPLFKEWLGGKHMYPGKLEL